jgi:nuclease-like protein
MVIAMSARRPGQHARETTRRKARRWLLVMATILSAALAIVLIGNLSWAGIVVVELLAIAGLVLVDRFAAPVVERWGRGAAGEEHVGRVLEELEADGWLTLHDVDTGRGNIDTIVVGPGGLFTVEVKSHGGRLHPERCNPAWLSQAYGQGKWLERITGRPVTALLVFSRAYLVGKPVSRQRGVVVLPARMLAGHLRRRAQVLSAEEARHVNEWLGQALGQTAFAADPPHPAARA